MLKNNLERQLNYKTSPSHSELHVAVNLTNMLNYQYRLDPINDTNWKMMHRAVIILK